MGDLDGIEHDHDLSIPFNRAAPPSAAPHLSPASPVGSTGAGGWKGDGEEEEEEASAGCRLPRAG